jgi:hypothetical protein
MNESTAFRLGHEWLRNAGESDEKAAAIAGPLERAVPEPAAHAISADRRLALLTDSKELYVVTIDFNGSASSVKIERIADLTADGIRLSYTEVHQGRDAGVRVVSIWRVDAGLERGPLEFRAEAQYQRGELRTRDSDKPAVAFGWHLAKATGWAPESADDGGPFVEVIM